MNSWKKLQIGTAIFFNPTESISKGKVAKKIPMGSLTEFQRKINSFEYCKYKSGPKFRNGDTIMAKITPCLENGKTAFVDVLDEEEIAFGSSEFIVLRKTPNTDPMFIYYLAISPTFRKRAISCMEGTSGRKRVSEKTLKYFELNFPPIENQKQIAKVLSDLDTKIELNNKINTELEAMAKLIYDYWFVQFDFPDENGKPYKFSGGKMVYNEELKREIPEGWEVKDLEDIESNIVTGKTPSTKKDEFYNGEIPFITIGDIRGNMHIIETQQTLSEIGANQNQNKFLPKGSICVTCIASPGLVGFVTKDSQTNQQINSIICKREENKFFLYFYLKDYFKFAKASSGSTFSNMNKGEFSSIKTIKPRKEILIDFSNKLESSINKILVNQLENQKLAELRDWLLPMLINGQVRVK